MDFPVNGMLKWVRNPKEEKTLFVLMIFSERKYEF
jgi:hypothetical protein